MKRLNNPVVATSAEENSLKYSYRVNFVSATSTFIKKGLDIR